MSAPTCAQCEHGTVTMNSAGDKCSHPNNVQGYQPYANRHDETRCGEAATWFIAKAAPSAVYRAK